MDIGLRRVMDGVEAARHIRARAAVPVIYVSAYVDEQPAARA
jgi:CheY-like chemotaxis protein